jgi:hypothetical protein
VCKAVRTGPTSSKVTEYRPHGLNVVSDQRAKWVGVVMNTVFILIGVLPNESFQNNSTCLQQFIALGIFPNVSGLYRRILMIEQWKVLKARVSMVPLVSRHQNKIILIAEQTASVKVRVTIFQLYSLCQQCFIFIPCITINYTIL